MKPRSLSLTAAGLAILPISGAILLTAIPAGNMKTPGPTTEAEPVRSFDVAEAPSLEMRMPGIEAPVDYAPAHNPRAPAQTSDIPVSLPRIAYIYGYSFRLPAEAVARVQDRHLGQCQALGRARCRVISLQRGEQGRQRIAASLSLDVAADIAGDFGRNLTEISSEAGGDIVDRTIAAEDLSRHIIDSEARIRTRETLIRRLTSLLETRSGNIEQAVQAERAINTAQEELEAARAQLSEMRGRVAMSRIDIAYRAQAALSATASRDPIGTAVGQVRTLAIGSLAAIILVAGALLPWLAVAGLAWLGIRRTGWRWSDPTKSGQTVPAE